MDVEAFLSGVRDSRGYRNQIVHLERILARPARFAEPQTALPPCLGKALRRQEIDQLYTHQAAAYDDVSQGRHVVVITGTASGKTLCYNLPVLNALLADPGARALYLFPTKALAQDQQGTLTRLLSADAQLGSIGVSTYDGDTPQDKRRTVRAQARIILSNPDMLHANILPHHGRWASVLANLKFVVVDEIHAYRGIFGSHVACVLRRLRRICRHYDCAPTFIGCSATIANPQELAEKLFGVPVRVIDDDGSPRGQKHFVFWNPPLVGDDGLARRSANIEAQRLMRELIAGGAQTIAFARARVVAELLYKYLREDLLRHEPKLADRVRPYRGGYLPIERREIERQLFSGQLLGVCSTNALELGIDVGSLDAALIVGFPGTICSTWQQAGRAGRSRDDALCVLVGYNEPIDQYLMRHPEYFFGQSPERAAVDPLNERILASQIRCAAAELPVTPSDDEMFGDADRPTAASDACARLAAEPGPDDVWHHNPDAREYRYYDAAGRLPHHSVSLRLMGNDVFVILDVTDGPGREKTIGQVDSISAPELVYPNAIYLHEGENYLVRQLDYPARIARVERTDVDYYTQVVLSNDCRILAEQKRGDVERGRKCFGRLDVSWQSVAFKKVKYYTLEVIGQAALDLPPQKIRTTGLWAMPPKDALGALTAAGFKPVEGMVGARNLLLVTLPMLAMCDRRDVSGVVDSSNLGELAMFVYDRYEGGLGYAEKGYEFFRELLSFCLELVETCPCDGGCPSCVGLPNLRPPLHTDPDVSGGYNIPNKSAAILLLKKWLSDASPASS